MSVVLDEEGGRLHPQVHDAVLVQRLELGGELADDRFDLGQPFLVGRHPFAQGHAGRQGADLVAPAVLLVRLERRHQALNRELVQPLPGLASHRGGIVHRAGVQEHVLHRGDVGGDEAAGVRLLHLEIAPAPAGDQRASAAVAFGQRRVGRAEGAGGGQSGIGRSGRRIGHRGPGVAPPHRHDRRAT
ncbi:hypothetical protein [Oleiharenicola sp. Vm1]|uniref:hypothetical protein n=1 Tax=Oleiharenicola sp. Vm1 TaxID=3398393 RepID=UPI0039F55863